MLVKDWLSVVCTARNIKVVDGNTLAYGTKKRVQKKSKRRIKMSFYKEKNND